MNFLKKYKITVVCSISLIIMILGIFFWNYIADLQNKDKNDIVDQNYEVDLSDVNNVPMVEAKLGEDIQITQGYLLTYTRKKSSIWYESSAYVKKIADNGLTATITLSNKDNSKKLVATIDSNKSNVKKGEIVNFVGTIDLNDGSLELSKITKDKIEYSSVERLEFNDLVDNIKAVKKNFFIINGYMVTENKEYKLYDSKDSYKKDKSSTNSFLIHWDDKFNLTGNATVTIKCLIKDTYDLKNCELISD